MKTNENIRYWIWLQRAVGKGANLERLLEPFRGDVQALCRADPEQRDAVLKEADRRRLSWYEEDPRERGARGGRSAPGAGKAASGAGRSTSGGQRTFPGTRKAGRPRPLADSTLQRMRTVSVDDAEDVLAVCERAGIVPLCPEDDCYPPLLKEIPTRPAVLYALGDPSLLRHALPIAMVGARDARLTSLCAASALAGTLARAGLLVVSGAAIGTDAACHIGALNAGCPTVAVLGTGIGTRYLMQNAELRRVISHNGVLLSEMEPGEPGSKGSFPLRNRIIAGMSIGTVVVEAAMKSGSLITSKYAEEFDREVFVPLFPGVDPEKPLAGASRGGPFEGTRELLERETGLGVSCAGDILAEYVMSYGIDLAGLILDGRVSLEELTRDITDPAGQFPPLLSREMVARARAQLAADYQRMQADDPAAPFSTRPAERISAVPADLSSADHASAPPAERASAQLPLVRRGANGELLDLAGGGALNASPGWGPYRTAEDAAARTYTSAEFTYRRGDHPHEPAAEQRHVTLSADQPSAADNPDQPPATQHKAAAASVQAPVTPRDAEAQGKTNLLDERSSSPNAKIAPTKPRADLSPEAVAILDCFSGGPRIDATRRNTTGRDATGRDATGRDTTGRDKTGRDATGRDTTGRDTTGRDTTRPTPALFYEEIADQVDLAPQYLFAALTELQLANWLDQLEDQRYVIHTEDITCQTQK